MTYSNELQTIISDSLENASDDKYDLCKPQDILKVENLSKSYGRNTAALQNVSFQIKRAEVNFCLFFFCSQMMIYIVSFISALDYWEQMVLENRQYFQFYPVKYINHLERLNISEPMEFHIVHKQMHSTIC